jgi:hypothetical protein
MTARLTQRSKTVFARWKKEEGRFACGAWCLLVPPSGRSAISTFSAALPRHRASRRLLSLQCGPLQMPDVTPRLPWFASRSPHRRPFSRIRQSGDLRATLTSSTTKGPKGPAEPVDTMAVPDESGAIGVGPDNRQHIALRGRATKSPIPSADLLVKN